MRVTPTRPPVPKRPRSESGLAIARPLVAMEGLVVLRETWSQPSTR